MENASKGQQVAVAIFVLLVMGPILVWWFSDDAPEPVGPAMTEEQMLQARVMARVKCAVAADRKYGEHNFRYDGPMFSSSGGGKGEATLPRRLTFMSNPLQARSKAGVFQAAQVLCNYDTAEGAVTTVGVLWK